MIGDVTLITEQQLALISGLATTLTHSALQTAPPFCEEYFVKADICTVRVVRLATLDTPYEAGFFASLPNGTTQCTDVLTESELILRRAEDKLVFRSIVVVSRPGTGRAVI